jgi:(2Fe-2S) ferredoxin
MTIYKNHMFICTNQKANDKPCCAKHNASEMVEHAKSLAKSLGLTKELKFRISSSGCLGQCAVGPVLVVYPEGEWHSYKTKEDIEQILLRIADKTLIKD